MTTAALWLSLALHAFAVAVAFHLRFARNVRGLNLPIILFFASTFMRRVVALDHGPSVDETACWNLVHSGLLVLWATTALRVTGHRDEETYSTGYRAGLSRKIEESVERIEAGK